ncbi:MAG: Hsp20 family protein [Pseudomonadota bacterium]
MRSIAFPTPTASVPFGYDVVRTAADEYRLDLPVPGFAEADLDVQVQHRTLVVTGTVADRPAGETLVHTGMVRRPFERRFALNEHMVVGGATLRNGVLSVTLVRQVPEALKPRQIAIAA